MEIVAARKEDFDEVFPLIQKLWSYNKYEEDATRQVYDRIVASPDSFAFVLKDGDRVLGFCHGDFFPTLWMCGLTCYISGIITEENRRRQGCGTLMLNHAKTLAQERGCKAMILDSGLPRLEAHRFYETYGFEKSCYGFEMKI